MGIDNLTAFWNRVRDSLWFVPGLLTLGSVILALVTIQLDVIGVLPEVPAGVWLFSGTASGAQGVLTAIASGFITVTGVVFSITIVALQLASTQFTPRILRNFTSDRVNQVVLGIFIGTFTYALLVLRVVRGEQGSGVTPEDLEAGGTAPTPQTIDAFVPHLSVTVAVVLAVVSIGFLIYFIDHAARSIRASVIIDRVASEALHTVERRLQERIGRPAEDAEDADALVPETPGQLVTSESSGYLQGVNEDALEALLRRDRLVIRMEPEIGDYLLPGGPLATVWPMGGGEDLEKAVRSAFLLGHERTPHVDIELGLIELADMAVKALSPGINDPTTARLCVDRIAEVLLAAGRRDPPSRIRRVPDGGGVLILPLTEFDELVDTALDEIRHYGVDNPRFAFVFVARLGQLGRLLPDDRKAPIARHVAAMLRSAREVITEGMDLNRIEREAARALDSLGVGAT